jgi:HAD superfamily hydrolase (TIGR01509 family)
MIKAIIFDLNGIFLQSEKLSDRFERDFNIPSSIFLPKLKEIMNQVRQPNALPAFSYWEPVFKEWGMNLNEEEFWKYWFQAEKQSDRVIEYAKNLKEKGLKIFVLSNNFKERANFYGHYPWMYEVVDKAYFSWQTGYVKPDVKAWEIVLSENNLKGEECIYFDDQEQNVASAKSLGIHSYIFTNEEELEEIINREIN